jgi:hypothetical protein
VSTVRAWEPRRNSEDACEDHTQILLCHVKLYIFSDPYALTPLHQLSLQKLKLIFARFTLHTQRIGDIVEMLRYSYQHTMGLGEKVYKL